MSLDGWSIVIGEVPEVLTGTVPAHGFFLLVAAEAVSGQNPICPSQVVTGAMLGGGLDDSGGSVRLVYATDGTDPARLGDAMSYGADLATCSGLSVPELGRSLHRASLTAPLACGYLSGAPSPCGGPPAPEPTSTPYPTPTATAALHSVLLTEVAYRGDCGAEWVELYNASASAVDLSGWALRDNTLASALDLMLEPGGVAVVVGGGSAVASECQPVIAVLEHTCIGNGLADDGDSVALEDATGRIIDLMSYGEDGASAPLVPAGKTLARLASGGALSDWSVSEPGAGCLQRQPTPTVSPTASPEPTALPTTPPSSATTVPQDEPTYETYVPLAWQRQGMSLPPVLLISEVLADGTGPDEGDEFVELRNYTDAATSLEGLRLTDAEKPDDGEAVYAFTAGAAVPPQSVVTVARCAAAFMARFGIAPDYELVAGTCLDTLTVPDLTRVVGRGSSPFALANGGDEVRLLAADDTQIDSVAYGNGEYAAVGLEGEASAPEPMSLHRVAGLDSDDMSLDFSTEAPSPGCGLDLPAAPAPQPAVAWGGYYCYWGNLHAHTSSSDGSGPAELAFARARAAGLHFYVVTDHSHWLRPVEWRRARSAAGDATVPGVFVALAGFEWTSPDYGHVNIIGGFDYVSHSDAATSDLAELYQWLAEHPETVAQFNHPGVGGYFGGRSDAGGSPRVRLQEVGSGASLRLYEDELLLSWRNDWHVAPTIGSDTDTALWGTDLQARTGVWATSLESPALLAGLSQGRAFATTDPDLALGWRCGDVWMGGVLATPAGSCVLYYADFDSEAATARLLDFAGAVLAQWQVASGGEHTFAWPLGSKAVWLKVTQSDGDMAWSAPVWADG